MDLVGAAAIAAVLVVGVAIGLWRRRADGRIRDVAPAGPSAAGAEQPPVGDVPGSRVASVAGGAAAPVALVADEREEPGVIDPAGADPSSAGQRLDADLLRELGVGEAKATLLQFSSAFCAPCRAVRRVSSEVAGMVPGVQHVEVDAESHLDAVRALGIWRTPTLLVLDADGRVAKRATGVPGKPQLIAALGDVL